MSHDHDWWYAWDNEEGCICGSCSDADKPYLWCEDCETTMTPADPGFQEIWDRVTADV